MKNLVHEAKDACRVKMDALTEKLDSNDPKLAQLHTHLNTTFDKFKIEGLWLQPIPFDQVKFVKHILAIRMLPNGVLADMEAQAQKLTKFLEEEVLEKSLRTLSRSISSDTWNVEMLEALRKIRGNITRKKNSMADAGDDPIQNSAFRTQDERFNGQLEDYRTKLKPHEVISDENDLKMVGLYDQLIGVVETMVQFTAHTSCSTISLRKNQQQSKLIYNP
ncbi:MAG: hypothetical protein IPL49_10770 [Saprospirales bacterium]|nr:hypothetical protein [Saprospirales bacterium]